MHKIANSLVPFCLGIITCAVVTYFDDRWENKEFRRAYDEMEKRAVQRLTKKSAPTVTYKETS
jgi:hypothetical protein